jgi:hypothetical protein
MATDQPHTSDRRTRRRSVPLGNLWGTFLFVLVVGIALAIFNLSASAGVSVRIPFTSSNLSLAGSVGAKAKVTGALPDYLRGRVAGNQNLINFSETMTIGPAQGVGLVVIGHQADAPVVDLHLAAH